MADLIQAHDWGATQLGAIDLWPRNLKAAVGFMLGSGTPMFIAWGRELVFLYNDAYRPILGAKAGNALGQRFAELWSEASEQVAPLVDRALAGEATWAEDMPFVVTRNGYDETAFFTFSYGPLWGETGQPEGLLATVVETTRQVLALRENERLLTESRANEERMRSIVDHVVDGIITIDAVGTIATFNQAADRIFGYSAAEVIGQHVRVLMPEPDRSAADDYVGYLRTGQKKIIGTGREVVGRRKDGTTFPMTLAISEFRLGEARHFTGIVRDITERTRADEAVRRSEAEFRGLFDLASTGTAQIDAATGRIVRVNQRFCEITGYSEVELLVRMPADITHPDDRDLDASLRNAAHRGEIDHWQIEKRYVRPSGEVVWAQVFGRFLRDDAGKPYRTIATAIDITERKRAEEGLRRSEHEFRSLFDLAAAGTVLCDATTARILRANRRYCEITGYTEDELRRRTIHDITYPDDRAYDEALAGPLRRGVTDHWETEKRYVRPDGEPVWVQVFGRFLKNDEGRPYQTIASVVDIAERKRAEEALRASEARHRFLVALNEATQDMTVPAELLATATRMLGEALGADRCLYTLLDPDEDRGENAGIWRRDSSVPSRSAMMRLSDFGAEPMRLVRSGLPFVMTDIERDDRTVEARDAFRAAGTAACIAVGVLQQGRLIAGIGVHQATPRDWSDADVRLVRDVATRVWEAAGRAQAQRALVESESRLRELAEAMPQIVYVTDAKLRILFINRRWSEYSGQSSAEVVDMRAVVHADDLLELSRRWSDAVRTETEMTAQFRLRCAADGEYRWFLMRAVPVRDARGRIERWFGTSTDIDTQKRHAEALQRAHDALQEADRRKDEWLAMLSHELRNPLAPLVNAHRLLARSDALGEKDRAALEMAQRQTRQLCRLVDDLLEVNRVSRGKIRLRREPMSVTEAVEAAIATVQPDFDRKRQQVEVAGPAGPVSIVADPVRIAQVLENLLHNASKFSPDGGAIRVEIEDGSALVEIRVIDDGIGMDPAQLESIFDLFTQADRSLARTESGLGIGLAVVRQMVELHGGRVFARSNGPGRGSKLTVGLPRRAAASDEQTA
jgi:PAS domain S-box-containing protein